LVDSENVKWYLTLFLLLTGIYLHSHSEIPTKQATESPDPYFNDPILTSETQNYTSHAPILVISDDNFTQNGFSGDGTLQSPYTIEYLNITVEFDSDVAIRISNVTKHFIISNCFVSTLAFSYPGLIVIENASNWKIEHTIVIGKGIGIGLYSDSCSNVSVVDSCFTDLWKGIWFIGLRGVLIWNNEFTNNQANGIICEFIIGCEILNNTFSNAGIGVLAVYVNQTMIMGNLFVGGVRGIKFYQIYSGLLIESNEFVNLSSAGISSTSVFSYSTPNSGIETFPIKTVIEYNTFVNCSYGFSSGFDGSNLFSNNTIMNCRVGVSLGCTSGNRIVGNHIQDSIEYGVSIRDAHQNQIYGNIIINSGIQNGFDENGENFWDDGEGEGNSWSDYNGTNVYSIVGSSNSFDRWPSRHGAPYISIKNETELIIGTTGVNITWNAFDSDPSIYTIYLNGTEIQSEIWNGGNVTMSLDDFEVGTYNLTAVVTDELGQVSSATVFVTITLFPFAEFLIISGTVLATVLSAIFILKQRKEH